MSTRRSNGFGPATSRRAFMKTGLGAAGALMLPGALLNTAWAKDYPSLGTFPAGASGDSVFVGLSVPLTGAYSTAGQDEKKGYELAFEHINNGTGMAAMMDSLKGSQGVLGKHVEYGIGDSETKPNSAVQVQTRFIHEKKAIMISGCSSSAVAIALEKLAQREKVVNMVGASGSNDTTGKDCQRYGFRSQPSAYMAGKALAPVVAKEIGKNVKAAYLVPDYTYGHTVFDSTRKFTEAQGWKTVSKVLVPVGASDYSSYLLNIANSGADVFVNVCFGNDSVASSKQAQQFGILDKMKMVVPNISPFQASELGPDIMAGVYGTLDFWWTMADRNDYAKTFVDSFEKKYGSKPRWTAHIAYLQSMIWADAVTRAGTFYPPEVIKTLESGKHIQSTLGEVYYRAEDHQMVREVPVVVGKSKSQMKSKEDYFEIVGVTPGEDVMPPPGTFACKLGSYT
ncbi:substrate-binding protein [Salinisphaera sp. LB1]|uniref:substrate-binding protein n=1 Tax=Salinisphaera sp. LB1 TaxID=2183911 RepID=UPI000D707239